jgi:hypothetical protein
MRIVQPGDPTYDASRRIANARFDYRPRYICYCESTDDVQFALNKAKREGIPVRIRSGGHQHEGMCSANGALIIDLSEINRVSIIGGAAAAWIGVGTKLGALYKYLLSRNLILPGGGCGDVRVGGLVQGGGWGPYSRKLGLTCDHLIGVEMVMASGEKIQVYATDPQYKKLFWALCGAGGGNFGIVTNFQLTLAPVSAPIWQFTVTWKDSVQRQPVMEDWRAHFPGSPEFNLTSFCRVSVSGPQNDDAPAIVAGYFMGREDTLKALLPRLLPRTYKEGSVKILPVGSEAAPDPHMAFHHPEYQPGPPLAALRAMDVSAKEAPTETCDGGWYPHKVSSCFPRSDFSGAATQAINTFLNQSSPEPNARRYLSLHCMGGVIGERAFKEASCFPYRDKPFMLQYQAWWGDRNDKPLGQRCLAWIRDFRERMKPFTEGAFINFPDKDLVPNPDTPKGRLDLLQIYYGSINLEILRRIKREYDPQNIFNFEMSIPPT